jgi:hypothetical protein
LSSCESNERSSIARPCTGAAATVSSALAARPHGLAMPVPSNPDAPFRHVHLVRVNDPANALDEFLTREQLWAGLWQTIVAPHAFDPNVDECIVDHVGTDRMARRVTRGGVTVRDEVDVVPPDSLTIRIDPAGAHGGSSLRIGIEEPAPYMLFVRFAYELRGEPPLPGDQATALRAAYEANDVDRIRQVRRYAARDREGR